MGGMQIFWLILLIFFIVIEAATVSLVSIWFAVGSVAGFIAAMLNVDVVMQWVIALVVSFIVILICRPLAKKQLKTDIEPTNVDSMIGKKCLVSEEINNLKGTGSVMCGDVEWSAKASDEDQIIEKETTVVIDKIEGVKAYVSIAK